MANTESNINNTVIDPKIEGKDWLEPIPFSSVSNESTPYPIQALPGILQTTVSEYQKYGQQPMALVACGALANVSLACQALADVARDDYLISPVSVYFISMASSGSLHQTMYFQERHGYGRRSFVRNARQLCKQR